MNLWQNLATICFATNWSYKNSTNVERNVTKVSTTLKSSATRLIAYGKMRILANYVYVCVYIYMFMSLVISYAISPD